MTGPPKGQPVDTPQIIGLKPMELIQVNAAVIAGLLVLFTLVSIQPGAQVLCSPTQPSNQSPTKLTTFVCPSTQPSSQSPNTIIFRDITLASVRLWAISAIIPFSLSSYYVTNKISLKLSKRKVGEENVDKRDPIAIEYDEKKLKTRFERALLSATIGFIYLMISAGFAFLFVILQTIGTFK
jgi:hypothetical protein